jgi:DNA polymerase-1
MTRVSVTDWEIPDLSSLPDRLAGVVGVDTETDDEGLRAGQGPGWAWRGGGRVVGYSVAADNCRVYLPIGHAEGNVDPDQARRWLNHVLGDATQEKVFANALYDIGWASADGVDILGPIRDVQLAEPLLDEHRLSYDLGAIALTRVGRGKDEAGLVEAGKCYGLGDTARAVKSNISKLPSWHVGPYAEEDAQLAREIWAAQRPLIEAEGLGPICALEHDLIPMYLDMRRRGVRIDVERVLWMRDRLSNEVAELKREVQRLTGLNVEIWEPRSVARVLDQLSVPYGETPLSREPQITNETLGADHPVCRALLAARQKDKLRGTFLEGQILGQLHGERVHGQVNPLKGDDGGGKKHGTVTGRLSMSNPNLMFVPTRTEEGRMIREAFLPEDGEEWAKLDVSQQEVRLLVHFAVLASRSSSLEPWKRSKLATAVEAQRRYREDPTLDYHQMVADMTDLDRKTRAKPLNFAIIYGRGVKETAAELELTFDDTKKLFAQHEEKMPFARTMSRCCQDRVTQVGYLTTLLKRRQRFPLWEPADWDRRDGKMLYREQAEAAWPGAALVRARIHKALNSLVQPSAADQTKKAMLDVWKAGYGRHVLVQVHDEVDLSTPNRKIANDVGDIMAAAVKLEVPVRVDRGFGPNWGRVD